MDILRIINSRSTTLVTNISWDNKRPTTDDQRPCKTLNAREFLFLCYGETISSWEIMYTHIFEWTWWIALLTVRKGGNFLKKLWCCVGGETGREETGRRLGDRFREHLPDVEKDDKNASKRVARHFNLPNHSKQHMTVCGLSQHQGSTESRKTLEKNLFFKSALFTLSTNAFHSTNLFCCFSRCQAPTNSVAPYFCI